MSAQEIHFNRRPSCPSCRQPRPRFCKSRRAGSWRSRCTWSLGVADLLASGSQTVEELARRTETHAPSLYRVLRCLASVGIFRETGGRAFELTPPARMLLTGEGSLRSMVLWLGDPRLDHVWESFLWSVQTGRPAVEET